MGGEEVVDVADRVVGARVALAPKRDGPRVQLVGPLPHVHLERVLHVGPPHLLDLDVGPT